MTEAIEVTTYRSKLHSMFKLTKKLPFRGNVEIQKSNLDCNHYSVRDSSTQQTDLLPRTRCHLVPLGLSQTIAARSIASYKRRSQRKSLTKGNRSSTKQAAPGTRDLPVIELVLGADHMLHDVSCTFIVRQIRRENNSPLLICWSFPGVFKVNTHTSWTSQRRICRLQACFHLDFVSWTFKFGMENEHSMIQNKNILGGKVLFSFSVSLGQK